MAGPPCFLVLNPNSSEEMSHGMKKAISSVPGLVVEFDFYTAPKASPASINGAEDLALSTEAVLSDLAVGSDKFDKYDGILVACFSVHPLVEHLAAQYRGRKVIIGIFEASVLASMALTSFYPQGESQVRAWGVVTTGRFWEEHLEEGVTAFLGQEARASNLKFAGVFSTGLDAGDFHGGVTKKVIEAKLKEATKRLLSAARVSCVVMGCAGMAGLGNIIRAAIHEQYGEPKSPEDKTYIIDGLKAGAGLLVETVRNAQMFSR